MIYYLRRFQHRLQIHEGLRTQVDHFAILLLLKGLQGRWVGLVKSLGLTADQRSMWLTKQSRLRDHVDIFRLYSCFVHQDHMISLTQIQHQPLTHYQPPTLPPTTTTWITYHPNHFFPPSGALSLNMKADQDYDELESDHEEGENADGSIIRLATLL